MLLEHKDYYRQRNVGSRPGPYCDKEWSKITGAIGKKAYHKEAKAIRTHNGQGKVVGGRALTYQETHEEIGWRPSTWY